MRLAVVSLALFAACGGGGGNGDVDSNIAIDVNYMDMPGSNAAMRYNPWKVGSTWTYTLQKIGSADVTGRVMSVEAYEDVGGSHAGQYAFRIHQELYSETKDVWEVAQGDLDLKYKTTFYTSGGTPYETDTPTPYRLKLDESAAHTKTGASWTETFMETDVVNGTPTTKTSVLDWSIVSDAESITVPAGTFTALHVKRMNTMKPEMAEFWYVLGVGRVKEINGDVTEILTSFMLAP